MSGCNIHIASISHTVGALRNVNTHALSIKTHLSVLRLAACLDAGEVDAGEPAESLAEEQHAVGQLDRRLVKHVAHTVDLHRFQEHNSQVLLNLNQVVKLGLHWEAIIPTPTLHNFVKK